jgi:transcriptional regulator with XRE-family HTH domain
MNPVSYLCSTLLRNGWSVTGVSGGETTLQPHPQRNPRAIENCHLQEAHMKSRRGELSYRHSKSRPLNTAASVPRSTSSAKLKLGARWPYNALVSVLADLPILRANADNDSFLASRYKWSFVMSRNLPNRQTLVKSHFAYLAMAKDGEVQEICHMDKSLPNRIREVRESLGMTIEKLAEETGLSVSYVSRLESGGRNLSVRNMNLFAHALKVHPEDLLSSPKPKSNVVSVMGKIGAGAEISPDEEQVPPEGLYEIEAPFPIPDDAIAFEVAGDSMYPPL